MTLKIRHRPDTGKSRREAYPEIGEQLDAVMKMATALKEQGIALPAETLEWIDACQGVKARFPKPDPTPAE